MKAKYIRILEELDEIDENIQVIHRKITNVEDYPNITHRLMLDIRRRNTSGTEDDKKTAKPILKHSFGTLYSQFKRRIEQLIPLKPKKRRSP